MRYKLFNGYYCLKNTEKIKLFSSSHFVISFLSLLISYLRRYSTLPVKRLRYLVVYRISLLGKKKSAELTLLVTFSNA